MVIDLFQDALVLVVTITVVIILPGLLTGLTVALFQAATQINEMTLSFIPRLLVTLVTLLLAGPWLLKELVEYTQKLIIDMPYMVG